jgi:hypothetical protein
VRWASSSVIGFDLFWQFPSPALRRTLRNCIFTDYLGHELEKFFSRQLGRWYRRSEMLQCRPRHSYPVFMFSKARPIIILKVLPEYKASIFVQYSEELLVWLRQTDTFYSIDLILWTSIWVS